jgi:hypothetical protein
MVRQLPPQPHPDVLKKQARQLLNDHKSGQSEAVARVQAVIADLPAAATESFGLRHAQQVLAREYGFSSWQALLDQVAGGDPGVSAVDVPFFTKVAADLVDAQRQGRVQSFGQLGNEYAARLASSETGDPGPEVALETARLAIAQHNGCRDWEDLARAHDETTQAVLKNGIRFEQLKSFERIHEDFAQLMGRRFGHLQGVDPSVEAKIAFVDRTHYGWHVVSAPSPWHCYKCSMDGLNGDVLLDFGANLVDGLVDDTVDRNQQLGSIAEGLMADLEQTWRSVAELRTTGIEAHVDPFALGLGMFDTCLLIAFEMTTGSDAEELPGIVSLCYPAPAITHILVREVAPAEASAK